MCRAIKTLHNFSPPATNEEIRASSLQFVRKLSRRLARSPRARLGRKLLVVAQKIFALGRGSQYETNYWWLGLRRDSLRSYSGTNCDVQLSLPRLPENNWRRVHSCFLCTGERIQDYQGHAEKLRHNQRNDGRQCARFLSGLRFAIVWGQERFRAGDRGWEFG